MKKPKKLSPSLVRKICGGAIRVCDITGKDKIGITEGIENAFAASKVFEIPFWAATTAILLEKWEPPRQIKTVVIVADNDKSFTGHAAAYSLAKKLVLQYKKDVQVYVPEKVGMDILDEWCAVQN